MKNKKETKTIEVICEGFYPTSDNWSPNFPRDTVEYRVYAYYTALDPQKGMIRIVFRGADDTGMDKDFHLPVSEYETKLQEIKYWIEHRLPNPITKQWLLDQGFLYW